MTFSKFGQRVLHALDQGGAIRDDRDARGYITDDLYLTRDGLMLAACGLDPFQRVRRRGLISSRDGRPHGITGLGRRVVRAQQDNR